MNLRAWLRAVVGVGVVALATHLRATQRAVVFLDGVTLPLDTDCHHHLWRALQTARDFPHVPAREPWINWPEGAPSIWAPGFDQLLALPVWIVGAARDAGRAARIMAWVPVALGVLGVLAAMALARALDPDPETRDDTALGAGLVVAALPLAVNTSMVGRTDHHVCEALISAAVAAWLLRPSRVAAPRRFEPLGALLVFGSVHVFAGSVMQWGVATVILALRLLTLPPRARAVTAIPGSGAPALLGGAALLLAVNGAWIHEHGLLFHHLQLSRLQPTLLAFAGLSLATLALVGARVASVARRVALTAAVVTALGGLLAALSPHSAHELVAGVRDWLATRDPWMASVQESRPLLEGGSLRWLRDEYGVLGLLAPVLFVLGARRASRGGGDAARVAVVFVGSMVVLTLLQRRFGRATVALGGALMALGVAEVATLLTKGREAWRAFVPALPLAAAALWCALDPAARELMPTVRGGWILGVHEAALFLRPPPGEVIARGRRPAVFAHWVMGHEVLFLAQRPVLVTGFGPYTSRATWDELEPTWRGDEAAMLTALDAHDARFLTFPASAILSQRSASGERAVKRSARGGLVVSATFLREAPIAAALLGGSGAPSMGVRHLAGLRPIFVDRGRVQGLVTAVPTNWIYERVRGARLTGEAPRGASVVVSVPMALRDIHRRWEAVATVRGTRWSVTVPLSTGWSTRGGVSTGARYTVTVNGARAGDVAVAESAVRDGATIDVRTEANPQSPAGGSAP
ncbi:MAG: hypothetical protein U0325_12470 [Polyangiales bacterium]